MAMSKMQILNKYKQDAPEELVANMESFMHRMSGYADIIRDPMSLYTQAAAPTTVQLAMEALENSQGLQKFGDGSYEPNAQVFLESVCEDERDVEDEVHEAVGMGELHRGNIQRLLENSAVEMRTAPGNMRNLGELTPYDAFLPFAIIRTYLPLIGKDLLPYIVPKQHFIRIKEQNKYIVTKDGSKHLEPDVYQDYDAVEDILNSAKGKRITNAWYPEDAVEKQADGADISDADFTVIEDGKQVGYIMKSGTQFRVEELDLLGESGGAREIGDTLDINICIDGIRAMVTNAAGTSYMVEITGLQHYLDVTSISPKNQLGGKVRIPVKSDDGKTVERFMEDTLMATYDPATCRVSVVSMSGLVKQVHFGGNMSNKNNTEYISFTDEYDAWEHPIPEGFRSNMPITVEDMRLYQDTASIDIIAYGINRMTEMFTNLEDTSIVGTIRKETEKWRGVDHHPFQHFKGRVFISRPINVKYQEKNPFMKKAEYVQDLVSNELSAILRQMRTTCNAEPFRVVAYCHPNVASLFVGDKVDWKINEGDSLSGGIRSDYNMGIITQDGHHIRLLTSMKFKEEGGVRGLGFPINEQNFLSWKHFKRALYFDRDHRIQQMPNNPNIMCVATFHTHVYVPLSFQLIIKDYDAERE